MQDGNWEPEAECDQVAKAYTDKFNEEMGFTVGYVGVGLDARESVIRAQETNLGNFFADLMQTEYMTDFGLINSGSIRKNCVIPAGPISLLTFQEMFPFNNAIMVLEMPGSILKEALEHSVSAYPAEEGCFPQVSNLKFLFDPSKPAGERILNNEIDNFAGGNFDPLARYTVAMPDYLASGGDGFSMFTSDQVKVIVDDENGALIIDVVKQFFKRTRTDFKIVLRRELARQMRLRRFHVDVNDETEDSRSPDGQFYTVKPRIEGRVMIRGGAGQGDYQ